MSPEEAFRQSSESITGPITKTISKKGILEMYNSFDKAAKEEFDVRALNFGPCGPGRTQFFLEWFC